MNTQKTKQSHIEILRLVGIIGLVFYHIGCIGSGQNNIETFLYTLMEKGWIGTDLFLVIAGYFFYEKYTKKYKCMIISYWKARALRLFPSYFLFLILYLTIGIRFENLLGNSFSMPSGYWLYLFTFTANIPMAVGSWSGVALEGLFGISILIQLIVFFSLLFKGIKQNHNRIILLILLVVFSITVRFILVFKVDEWFSYFFTFTRMDGFVAGILLGLLRDVSKSSIILKKHSKKLLFFTCISVVATAPLTNWWKTTHSLTAMTTFPLLALFFAALLNYILEVPKPGKSVYIGDFVYSLYLVKLPLIYAAYGFLEHSYAILNKPFFFILLAFLICFLWGILFYSIHKKRREIILLRFP